MFIAQQTPMFGRPAIRFLLIPLGLSMPWVASGFIGGGGETRDFPAVVFINGECTASFISKRVILTAAHCFRKKDLKSEKNGVMTTRIRIKGGYHGKARIVFRSAEINPWVREDYYDLLGSKMDETVDFDQALLILPLEQPVQPLAVCQTESMEKDPVTLVGFGYDVDYRLPDPEYHSLARNSLGIKRKGQNTIRKVDDEVIFLLGEIMTLDHRPTTTRNITQGGDSGGPILREDGCIAGTVIGLHQVGSANLFGPVVFEGKVLAANEVVTVYQRTDTSRALEWISEWIR